eukprot:bmy_18842T0
MQVAAEPGEKTSSRGQPVGIPLLEQEPEEALGLNQLPAERLLMVLSHVPQHMLLRHRRQVCRRWRNLVDCQALWLSILPRKHAALWPIVSTCLPAADDLRPCVLGRFCERRPIGRNLLLNPRGLDGFPEQPMLSGGDGWTKEGKCKGMPAAPCEVHFLPAYYLPGYRWFRRKEVWDLEKEGFWPELLDSGKIEICVSACWMERRGTNRICIYQLIVQTLDVNQAVLHHFSSNPFPIRRWRRVPFEASHVFSNLKNGVRFVSFEQWVSKLELGNEQYGVPFTNSSVFAWVCLS